MKFRKDINGLRAIAVIAVVLFHFKPTWVPGGFAGVDVFFVISGFLMTGVIFEGIKHGDFSILRFYVARANRIIPALAALCFVLLVWGWFYLTPFDFKSLGKSAAASVTFMSNVVYWRESGYFDAASLEKWLLHTWSLSVEWQFYILYPLILLGISKFFSVRKMKLLALIAAVSGFLLSVFVTYKSPTAAYYLLPTRAWEMLVGGIAYLYPLGAQETKKKILGVTGFFLIAGSYFYVSAETAWPGYMALFPVMGSFLVIWAHQSNSFITNNPLFQKIGTWSYSIYLWHWPIVVAINYFSLDGLFVYLGIALSGLLGFLSHHYIEQYKFLLHDSWKAFFRIKPLYFAVAVATAGWCVDLSDGVDTVLRQGASSDEAVFLNYYAKKHKNLGEAYWHKCNTYTSLNKHNTYDIDPVCIEKQHSSGGVFLWGDSHAESLSLGLRTLLKSKNIPFYQKTSAGCRASLDKVTHQRGIFRKACDHSNKEALESIERIKPTIVLIAQANEHDRSDWDRITRELLRLGVSRVVVVGPLSQWKPSLPKIMIKPKNWKNNDEFISDIGLDLDVIEIDGRMKLLKHPIGFEYISLIDELCKKNIADNKYYCRVRIEGKLLQVDYGHLSEAGSLFVVNRIISNRLLALYNDATSSRF